MSNAEVGAVVDEVTNTCTKGFYRDIIIQRTGDIIRKIPDSHHMADPLTYPLLFPRGDEGWGCDQIRLARTTRTKHFVTALKYLRYRIQSRDVNTPGGGRDYHLQHGRLTQEWIVNSYVKIEGHRLDYLYFNQKKIKADTYREVQKAQDQSRYKQVILIKK